MTFSEAKQSLARKLGIDYSDIANNDLFSDADLGEWINFGALRAWNYKPWPFTEGSLDVDSGAPNDDYIDHPDEFEHESIFLLRVNGKEYRRLNWQDYRLLFEEDPTSTEKVWTDRGNFIFINKLAHSVGDEVCLFGKKKFTQLSGANDLLPFSPSTDNNEYSGNIAIVQFAYAETLGSEKKKKPAQAKEEETKAYHILDELWRPVGERRSFEQSKGRPMFDVPDYFSSGKSTTIGNFDL